MTTQSMDTRGATEAPRHFIDTAQPDTPIPEVEPIGDREAIDDADEATLTAKFEEYAVAAPILVDHHDWQRIRFDETYGHYVRIFTSLETLETIKLQTEAVAPKFNLLEEFELIELPDDMAKASAVIGTATLYGGALAAFLGLAKAGYDARTASRALAVARGQPIGAARRASIVAKARTASRWKVLGVVGAVLTVGSAAVGIVATIENGKRRMQFLRDSVDSYQTWYAATRQGIRDMEAASIQMEREITALLTALGFGTPEELEAFLGGAVQDAGQLQGALNSATRMLCAGLAVADVAGYTALPLATVQRRAALIAQDPSICSLGG